jgi:RNA polymerase sigma factor (sigma-70 family)
MSHAISELAGLSDSELISACLRHDADAWEILIRRYQRLIASITVKFKLQEQDAADIFQAVSVALFKQLRSFDRQAKLSSWIITVTVRECWKLRQRSGRTVLLDDPAWETVAESADPDASTSEDQILLIERQHLVRTALGQIGAQCQSLLRKLFYSPEQLSYAELAEETGIPVASIGPTRGRCLTKLKAALEKMGYR